MQPRSSLGLFLSMALLATPSLGILLSAVTLGEAVGPSLVAGVLLIGAGIRLATTAAGPTRAVESPGEPQGRPHARG